MFDTAIFGGNGTAMLELITYHTLALGFIASAFKSSKGKLNGKRAVEIFNTGVNTVSTYLLQAVCGFAISLVAVYFVKDFFPAAGVLLPFGYGQGTGQALNYGTIYEGMGFTGGKSFGLTIAALGFISASIGGVIHLNVLRKKGKIGNSKYEEGKISSEQIQSGDLDLDPVRYPGTVYLRQHHQSLSAFPVQSSQRSQR
jgi:ESS family glutamate:Na+ symporter